jgi:hypothetical protein
MISHEPPASPTQPPLSIVLERLDATPDGHFRPNAFIKLTKAFRTSGLLQTLPPEEIKSFFTLLSFLTPTGDCSPTLGQLASAMRVSHSKARTRMQRLAQVRFEQEPLLVAITHGNGQEAYALKSKHIPVIEGALDETEKPKPLQAVSRQQVIEYSRRHYARSREEVERQMAEINGWELPQLSVDSEQTDSNGESNTTSGAEQEEAQAIESPARAQQSESVNTKDLRQRLQDAGVAADQIENLLSSYDTALIEKQLKWLPFRHARNPSAYLVAAITGNYARPRYRR